MDTLPLNGNHGNSYSLAGADYVSDCVRIIERGFGGPHPETTLEKRILKELTSNYLPSYLNNCERSAEHSRNLVNKLVNNVGNVSQMSNVSHVSNLANLSNNGSIRGKDPSVLPVDLALDLDDSPAFVPDEGLGLELIREESDSDAPLLPRQRPSLPAQPLSSFGSGPAPSASRRRLPQENSESFFPLLTEEQREETPEAHRDLPESPELRPDSRTLPRGGGDGHTHAEPDDVYYKSMPNLGSRNHLHQLHSYYQLGRGSSDGFIGPASNKDEASSSSADGTPQEPPHLVTSL